MMQQPSESLSSLIIRLQEIEKLTNDQWMHGLAERKRKELEFHDRERDRSLIATLDSDTYERFYGNKKYYKATALSKSYVDDWIRFNAPGNVFLDYACGNGFNAIKAAKAGAKIAIGIDLSAVSINNAKQDAVAQGVADKTFFIQADAENTLLPDSSIDRIICSGMLHHLDLSLAFPELQRILNSDGRILAVEALDYNPIIKLYRHLTPEMRTEWEKAHILNLADVNFAKKYFDVENLKFWHITSMLGAHLPRLLPIFNFLDRVLTKIPIFQLLAWMFTFELLSRKQKR